MEGRKYDIACDPCSDHGNGTDADKCEKASVADAWTVLYDLQ